MNKRNVLTDGFTADDFMGPEIFKAENARHINQLLAAAKRDTQRVIGCLDYNGEWYEPDDGKPTHTALLICVEPIEGQP